MKWLREKCNRRCLIKCCTQAKCTTALMWKEYRSVSSLVQPGDDLHRQLDFHTSKHVCHTQTTRHTTPGSNIQNKLFVSFTSLCIYCQFGVVKNLKQLPLPLGAVMTRLCHMKLCISWRQHWGSEK